ncbi:MAG: hypothetical protein NTY90_03585 [Candidatus Micrarchaeota archaeon]|nr:hypothetical protein [Candidatus Micrarchaeota archaeon]
MFEKELEDLGFSANEARIYVSLLELGPTTPLRVSAKTGLHRAYVYDALERMIEKGLASTVMVGRKRHFQAAPPRRFEKTLELRLNAFKEVLPRLEGLAAPRPPTTAEVYAGKSAYKIALLDALDAMREGDEFLAIGIDEAQAMERGDFYLKRYFKIVQRKHITERIIIRTGGPRATEAKTTTYRSLDAKYLGNVATWIYCDRVVLIVAGSPDVALIIRNKEMADTYRKQFELLWATAKK